MLFVPAARYIPEGMRLAGATKITSQSPAQLVKLISLRLLIPNCNLKASKIGVIVDAGLGFNNPALLDVTTDY